MALSGACRDGMELRIQESVEELSTDLADYISDLSEATIKERGAFCIAISGGSLVSLMRYIQYRFVSISFVRYWLFEGCIYIGRKQDTGFSTLY